MINLVLQAFGRENEYKRTVLTILSFYSYNSCPVKETKVILFTDQPDYFKTYLDKLPIHYVLLTQEKIKQMRGNIDFLHRMKIALIEEAFGLISGIMLYADSDTFFISDPVPLTSQLCLGKSFMHVREYMFDSLKHEIMPAGKVSKAFFDLVRSNTFLMANGDQVRFSLNSYSWNAGVMMFHAAHEKFLPDVFALTDQFYRATLSHASEQYAFSLILQDRTLVEPCESVIYHYWYRVKKQIMDVFLAENINQAWSERSLPEKLDMVKTWCQRMPAYLDNHILMIRDNAIQAFNRNKYLQGYNFTLRALSKAPFDKCFIKDVFYHTRKWINL